MSESTREQRYIYKLTGRWEDNEYKAEDACSYGDDYLESQYPKTKRRQMQDEYGYDLDW